MKAQPGGTVDDDPETASVLKFSSTGTLIVGMEICAWVVNGNTTVKQLIPQQIMLMGCRNDGRRLLPRLIRRYTKGLELKLSFGSYAMNRRKVNSD